VYAELWPVLQYPFRYCVSQRPSALVGEWASGRAESVPPALVGTTVSVIGLTCPR
jgi:hypothetical protein